MEPRYDTRYNISSETVPESHPKKSEIPSHVESKPPSTDMMVLGELNHGTKNFDALQKILGDRH